MSLIEISLNVNGISQVLRLDTRDRLIDALREGLSLTGTKRGCDDASCGACTVIVNGSARRACVTGVKTLEGADVESIESLAKGLKLHPIQTALIEAGAVQCGYCTPGIAMELKALFDKNLEASREEIIKSLSRHFCRCTGYEAILEGALLAQKRLKENN
ncbi:MAG: (2Fe-2S)-binding protein [Bradymonadia bacterium]|jgi:aerobic-type carbon monoxide dehydrogenase small subunit (CoxS/CutS family)